MSETARKSSILSSPLERHILLRLSLVALFLSALLLAVFLMAYRGQLEAERSRASVGFNLLLQATLENAMLKRDVPGLKDVVERLGRQSGIRAVMILNPSGEVRFASRPELLGRQLPGLVQPALKQPPSAEYTADETGAPVLRSVNAVHNQEPCQVCHGPVTQHPVNGVLVLDYDAGELHRHAWQSAALLAGAAVAVLLVMMLALWRMLDRRVLGPVARLAEATAALEDGQLDRRVELSGDDELSALGKRFNLMADRLQEHMALVQAQQDYLQQILDSLPDGVRVIRARDHQVVLANRAWCQQLGKDAVLAGTPCYQDSHGRDTPCIPTMVVCPLHALNKVGDTLKATHRHHTADGRELPVEINAALVEIRHGASAERYLVEAVRDLAQAARISQEQRLSELGLLAAGIAHEIHNPLASVRMAVQGLARDIRLERCTPRQIGDYLSLMDGEIDKCVNVTRRLLMLSRIPQEGRQIVSLGAALSDTLQLIEYDAQKRKVRQHLELPPDPVHVLADESEMRMVFLNLLQNAHHAMPEGGELNARVSTDAEQVYIDIRDTGVGIPEDVLGHIFDPFFSRRADGEAGTGLGLTIVKNVVDRSAGRIEVESTPGQGTLFRVILPLASSAGI